MPPGISMRGALAIGRRYVLVDSWWRAGRVLAQAVTLSYPVSDTGVAARMIDPGGQRGRTQKRDAPRAGRRRSRDGRGRGPARRVDRRLARLALARPAARR